MLDINEVGKDWLLEEVENLTDHIDRVRPSDFNEANRYLPESVTALPGYIRYSVNPYMLEILNCFDVDSPIREVNVKKGVQVTYTTLLESGLLYYMAQVKTLPVMFLTADKELALARIENNVIPMIDQSGYSHIIRSSDVTNKRKTGKTKDALQWEGGGYLVPFGARNADKMRSFSIAVMLKDELDAWPDTVGKNGDPDVLSDARCSGYWERRKIFRGSTPLLKGMSKIEKAYLRGDQRQYYVRCKRCGYAQVLRWKAQKKGGFNWEVEDGSLVLESVRYCCKNCNEPHYEHDKDKLFSPEYGAEWRPTAKSVEPYIRSYHIPAFLSPVGLQPWYKCVSEYLSAFDQEHKKVIDISRFQTFYNNILAEPFEMMGSKVRFVSVSAHRRPIYRFGSIPNKYAKENSASPILFLVCCVDVHRSNLAISVFGCCRDVRCYLIDYFRLEAKEQREDCGESDHPHWQKLRELIEEKIYTADDGKRYGIAITLIDAGYRNDTVVKFCSDYSSGVYPILGRDRPAKNQTIKEFAEFKTQLGGQGFRILVDHYKDRLAPILRRNWVENTEPQKPYHFNAPVDCTDTQLKELTVETRRKKTDERGIVSYYWHRPGNARNELWDLLVYFSAAVDIMAFNVCIRHFELETVDWQKFWEYLEKEKVFFDG